MLVKEEDTETTVTDCVSRPGVFRYVGIDVGVDVGSVVGAVVGEAVRHEFSILCAVAVTPLLVRSPAMPNTDVAGIAKDASIAVEAIGTHKNDVCV
jgi:hypothetical protein